MSTLNFNHNIDEIKSEDFKSLRCTILIPEMYLKTLYKLTEIYSHSIENLITKFSILIEKRIILIRPNYEKHTTLYQSHSKPKLNLSRRHFRCNPMVWHHWKRLADHFGVSMCYLFLICLKKVTLKDLASVGAPTETLRIHNYIFYELTNFTRYYSHRWFFSRIFRKNKVKNFS